MEWGFGMQSFSVTNVNHDKSMRWNGSSSKSKWESKTLLVNSTGMSCVLELYTYSIRFYEMKSQFRSRSNMNFMSHRPLAQPKPRFKTTNCQKHADHLIYIGDVGASIMCDTIKNIKTIEKCGPGEKYLVSENSDIGE